MIKNISTLGLGMILISMLLIACDNDDNTVPIGKDINSATRVIVDRFSATAGHLMIRTPANGLPGSNAAINFDSQPFITTGLDRTGAVSHYYNFDIQPTMPSPIYVFFRNGETTPINGQNNIVASIPGDSGYSDFWLVTKVTVPDNYVPNSLTSEEEVLSSGYTLTATTDIVNCPIVPFGSSASRSKTSGTASMLTLGWYESQAVAYFTFDEAPLLASPSDMVPLSPIYVLFNDNATGPASGFKAEDANPAQTHNVLATLPGDAMYSPLWSVRVIDNVHFDSVFDLASATSFASTPAGVNVNCPIVK